MAKDPAFLFYPNDWMGGTMGMTFEEKGAYLELLVMQWNCHRITDEYAKRVVGEKLWYRISHKFAADGSGFFNKRLEDEKVKRRKHSEKQSINAKKRWGSGNATALPLEDVNENRDEIKNVTNKEERKNEFLKNQKWKEEFCMAKNLKMPDLEKLQNEFIADTDLKGEHVDSYKRYFTNWFNKHKNGSTTHKQSSPGNKPGTSDRRTEAARKW